MTGDFTILGALNVLNKYMQLMTDCPQYFRYAQSRLARNIYSQMLLTVMPRRDKHGRRVFVCRPGFWNPNKFSFSECFALGYMMSEMMALEPKTQVAGVTCVADASNFGWKQLWNFTVEDAKNSARFIQVTSFQIC